MRRLNFSLTILAFVVTVFSYLSLHLRKQQPGLHHKKNMIFYDYQDYLVLI